MDKYNNIIISSTNNCITNMALLCLICILIYYLFVDIHFNTIEGKFKNKQKKKYINKKNHTNKRPSILVNKSLNKLHKKNKRVRFKLN